MQAKSAVASEREDITKLKEDISKVKQEVIVNIHRLAYSQGSCMQRAKISNHVFTGEPGLISGTHILTTVSWQLTYHISSAFVWIHSIVNTWTDTNFTIMYS